MKKIIFLALVALLGIHTVDAQRRGGTCTPEQIVEKLDKKLNLTDEQEKQITELYTEFFKKELSREVWGIERSGFFNGREKWAKGFENQRV